MKRPPSSAQSRSIPLARALFSFRASLRARSGATSTADRDALADALSAAASSAAPLDHTAVTAALRALASAGEEDGVVDLDWVEDVEKIREEVGVLVKARDDEGDKELGNRILRGAEGDGQGQANAGSGKGQASWENVPLQALGPVPARPGDGQSQAHASRSEDRSRRGRGQWSAGAEEVKFPLNTFRLNRTVGTGEEYAYTIDHVLVSRPVKLVLIMNFMIDLPWLRSVAQQLFSADRIILVHGMAAATIDQMIRQTFDDRTRRKIVVIKPRVPQYGTVHAKSMLTFCGDAGCRVLIHTSNDIAQDWMQRCQGAYLRDFPLKADSTADGCEFEEMLVYYLSAVGAAAAGATGLVLLKEVLPLIRIYDFSGAGCALVASVPGVHGHRQSSPETRDRYGLWRLRSLLEREDIDDTAAAAVVVQFSSLGSIQPTYLEKDVKGALFACASRRAQRGGNAPGLVKASDALQLVLPTLEEVVKSNESVSAGESLPVRASNVHRDHIASILHKWEAGKSGRGGAMPHMKSILRYSRKHPEVVDWMYIGSANLSGAAWGRPRKGGAKAGGSEYLDVWSFELGVLFTPSRYQPPSFVIGLMTRKREILPMAPSTLYTLHSLPDFQGRRCVEDSGSSSSKATKIVALPIPYALPPVKYTSDDVPWHVDVGQQGKCSGQWGKKCTAALARLGISPFG